MARKKRKKSAKVRTKQRELSKFTKTKEAVLLDLSKTRYIPSRKKNLYKKEFKRLEKNDLKRLDRLKRPRFYIKRNYLGLPIAVKMANLTPFRRKKSELMYKFSPNLKRLIICARRNIRRQVLFAKGGAGNGKRNIKPYRVFNKDSHIKC